MFLNKDAGKSGPGRTLGGALLLSGFLIAGCASSASGKKAGAYYLDDGPGKVDEARLARMMKLPDPVPVPERLRARANRPYTVMGKRYVPMTERLPYRQQGVASWYGQRFHGKLTSIGEPYDMYGMTAAHPTLPLPSYVRVRSLENGRAVVVRVNDRGPFLRNRLIDLSFLAAHKLGYVHRGHARVEVELIDPAAIRTGEVAGRAPSDDADARDMGSTAVTASEPVGARSGAAGSGAPLPDADPGAYRTGPAARRVEDGRVIFEGWGAEDMPPPIRRIEVGAGQADAPADPAGRGDRAGSADGRAEKTEAGVGTGARAGRVAGDGAARARVIAGAGGATAAGADGATAAAPGWYLQYGVFRQMDNARRLQREQQVAARAGDPPVAVAQRNRHYVVRQGPFADQATASAAAARLVAAGGVRPKIVQE